MKKSILFLLALGFGLICFSQRPNAQPPVDFELKKGELEALGLKFSAAQEAQYKSIKAKYQSSIDKSLQAGNTEEAEVTIAKMNRELKAILTKEQLEGLNKNAEKRMKKIE